MNDLHQDLARSIVGAPALRLVTSERELVFVMAELALAECKLSKLRDIRGRDLTVAEDAEWSKLEDTIDLRRDEARSIIERQTGVPWSSIEAAQL